jgi:sulfoxide reductase heme-binding subunit YedZ
MTSQYIAGSIYYGEFIHATGEFSARLLIVTMAATPLRLMWPTRRWTAWLVKRRRYFGVAAFAYAMPHLIAYLVKLGTLDKVLQEAPEPGMWTGWLALLLFMPLAMTSNNASVRALGRRWKTLHRLVYLAALLTFAHWLLVAFDPVPGLAHAGVLVCLESYRLWKSSRINRTTRL